MRSVHTESSSPRKKLLGVSTPGVFLCAQRDSTCKSQQRRSILETERLISADQSAHYWRCALPGSQRFRSNLSREGVHAVPQAHFQGEVLCNHLFFAYPQLLQ